MSINLFDLIRSEMSNESANVILLGENHGLDVYRGIFHLELHKSEFLGKNVAILLEEYPGEIFHPSMERVKQRLSKLGVDLIQIETDLSNPFARIETTMDIKIKNKLLQELILQLELTEQEKVYVTSNDTDINKKIFGLKNIYGDSDERLINFNEVASQTICNLYKKNRYQHIIGCFGGCHLPEVRNNINNQIIDIGIERRLQEKGIKSKAFFIHDNRDNNENYTPDEYRHQRFSSIPVAHVTDKEIDSLMTIDDNDKQNPKLCFVESESEHKLQKINNSWCAIL
ncbi:MAG: hypothetical protein EP298_00895 [Gammaproteobacteria bacterium]|nr:MAG: hypothetical protein EP298_00895 [Gammaproteobacteria bacterium]UTW41825.1 hypothetical protein KFE69_09970 [bacterium SCSIO 12844]